MRIFTLTEGAFVPRAARIATALPSVNARTAGKPSRPSAASRSARRRADQHYARRPSGIASTAAQGSVRSSVSRPSSAATTAAGRQKPQAGLALSFHRQRLDGQTAASASRSRMADWFVPGCANSAAWPEKRRVLMLTMQDHSTFGGCADRAMFAGITLNQRAVESPSTCDGAGQ